METAYDDSGRVLVGLVLLLIWSVVALIKDARMRTRVKTHLKGRDSWSPLE